MGVDTVQVQFCSKDGVDAYWVPYHGGTGLPGWADVLKSNPTRKFVFTAGMNGCAFIVTDSPQGAAYMRVYHNQHPASDLVNNSITQVGQPVISRATFDDYFPGYKETPGKSPLAFNFLYYKAGAWTYVFQSQTFDSNSNSPAKKQNVRAKSVF